MTARVQQNVTCGFCHGAILPGANKTQMGDVHLHEVCTKLFQNELNKQALNSPTVHFFNEFSKAASDLKIQIALIIICGLSGLFCLLSLK